MKVLVDECVPLKLVRLLTGHEFTTAQEKGWGSFRNGRLLDLAEPAFDLFLTADRMRYEEQSILAELGTEFQLQEVRRETHLTPWRTEQRFIYFRFRWQTP